MLRVVIVLALLVCSQAAGQEPDPAAEPLHKAYTALKQKQYDEAVNWFTKALGIVPSRAAVRKDLAYAYLKIGETEAARDQFGEAMRLNPNDFHVALEYAFLCHETRETARARRVFDRVRKSGDPESRKTAEQAFDNIDRPLAEGIARWSKVAAESPDNFMAHYELAQLAEQRDELELAEAHYLRAWQILPARRSLLLDLGRVRMALNRIELANASFLAASRGVEPRSREAGLEKLPKRFPYVSEFRQAIQIEPTNVELRRDLAFLLLKLERQEEAEREFRSVLEIAPDDLLASAQLGFLYLARSDKSRAMPLLDRVLKGSDPSLANRVRIMLHMPVVAPQPVRDGEPTVSNPKTMAERSMQAGFLKDALHYLQAAHESNSEDPWVMLKLGWAYNLLHDDVEAVKWFDRARHANDPQIAAEARKAYENLKPGLAHVRTTAWMFPFFSSRWHDVFSYGQLKTDFRLGKLPIRPYLSTRFMGDTRRTTGGPFPQYLSENSVILAGGLSTKPWNGISIWGEAGWAVSYLKNGPNAGKFLPDYRGGIAFARSFGRNIGHSKPGVFFETNADGILISRFDDDILLYSQNRLGVTLPVAEGLGGLQTQFLWNGNYTRDTKRQGWANFAEYGPGLRFRWRAMPRSLMFSANILRGAYTISQNGARAAHFYDLRVGFWYAVTR